MDIESLKFIRESGLGIASFLLCFWLIRAIVLSYGKHLETLANSINCLTGRIETWNKEAEISHSLQKQEHEKIIERLAK